MTTTENQTHSTGSQVHPSMALPSAPTVSPVVAVAPDFVSSTPAAGIAPMYPACGDPECFDCHVVPATPAPQMATPLPGGQVDGRTLFEAEWKMLTAPRLYDFTVDAHGDYSDRELFLGWRMWQARASTQQAAPQSTLHDWLTVIHDNDLSLGDRLQRISVQISGILRGDAPAKFKPHTIREQDFDHAAFAAAMVERVAWFRQPSSFGPWVECKPTDEGATHFTAAPAQAKLTTAVSKVIRAWRDSPINTRDAWLRDQMDELIRAHDDELAITAPAQAATDAVRDALTEAQKNVIRYAAEALEDLDYEDTAGELRDILRTTSTDSEKGGAA